jgi:hypothetical protein
MSLPAFKADTFVDNCAEPTRVGIWEGVIGFNNSVLITIHEGSDRASADLPIPEARRLARFILENTSDVTA